MKNCHDAAELVILTGGAFEAAGNAVIVADYIWKALRSGIWLPC